MSAVNLCDRCGGLMLGKAAATMDYQTGPDAGYRHVELCPGCIGAFVEWMGSQSEPMSKTPYREPWKAPEDRPMLERGNDA